MLGHFLDTFVALLGPFTLLGMASETPCKFYFFPLPSSINLINLINLDGGRRELKDFSDGQSRSGQAGLKIFSHGAVKACREGAAVIW